MGRLETAMADYHKALELGSTQKELKSRMALLHNAIGVNLYNNKDYQGSNIEFSRAIYFHTRVPDFYVNRAKA
jgi:tetratricopeptide (TPR) repeat protein